MSSTDNKSLHIFVKQFIAAAVAPTKASPVSLKKFYEDWHLDCRNQENMQRMMSDNYESKYNQKRIAINVARRAFDSKMKTIDGKTSDELMQQRPVEMPSDIFTKHILE